MQKQEGNGAESRRERLIWGEISTKVLAGKGGRDVALQRLGEGKRDKKIRNYELGITNYLEGGSGDFKR